MVAELHADKRNQLTISETEKEIRIGLSEKSNGVNLAKQVQSMEQLRDQHAGLIGWMSDNKLMGSAPLLDMSLSMFNGRSAYYSLDNIRKNGNEAYERGIVEGIHKVHQATAQRNASFNGFRADLMTQQDWGYTIANQTRQWSQQNAASAMMFVAGVATLPMLAADLLAVGALAGRGAMALGRGVMNTADDMGRSLYASYQATGIRGTVLNVASTRTGWTAVESANLTALRSTALRLPSTLEASINRGAIALMNRASVGMRAVGTRLGSTSDDMIAGGISGGINVAFEYAKNPNKPFLDYAVDFGTGFAGGFVGNRFASIIKGNMVASGWGAKQALIASERFGGFVSGATSKGTSLYLNEQNINLNEVLSAGALGAGVGVGIASTLPKVFSNVTQFGLNSTIGSFYSSVEDLNNRFEYYQRAYFGK